MARIVEEIIEPAKPAKVRRVLEGNASEKHYFDDHGNLVTSLNFKAKEIVTSPSDLPALVDFIQEHINPTPQCAPQPAPQSGNEPTLAEAVRALLTSSANRDSYGYITIVPHQGTYNCLRSALARAEADAARLERREKAVRELVEAIKSVDNNDTIFSFKYLSNASDSGSVGKVSVLPSQARRILAALRELEATK